MGDGRNSSLILDGSLNGSCDYLHDGKNRKPISPKSLSGFKQIIGAFRQVI